MYKFCFKELHRIKYLNRLSLDTRTTLYTQNISNFMAKWRKIKKLSLSPKIQLKIRLRISSFCFRASIIKPCSNFSHLFCFLLKVFCIFLTKTKREYLIENICFFLLSITIICIFKFWNMKKSILLQNLKRGGKKLLILINNYLIRLHFFSSVVRESNK